MNDLERRRKMASQIAGSFDDEPDVTPKTESGRAYWLDQLPRQMGWYREIETNMLLTGYLLSPADMARTREEAASKAVAEYRTEISFLRSVVASGERLNADDNARLDALIASERKP